MAIFNLPNLALGIDSTCCFLTPSSLDQSKASRHFAQPSVSRFGEKNAKTKTNRKAKIKLKKHIMVKSYHKQLRGIVSNDF